MYVCGITACVYEFAVGFLLQLRVKDTVSVCPDVENEPLYIARIAYMWEDNAGKKKFHANWFSRPSDTVLGEVGDPCELFQVDQCDDNPLGAIMDKVNVSCDNSMECGMLAMSWVVSRFCLSGSSVTFKSLCSD